jgi:hypothetical protein
MPPAGGSPLFPSHLNPPTVQTVKANIVGAHGASNSTLVTSAMDMGKAARAGCKARSVPGQSRHSDRGLATSGLPQTTDIIRTSRHVSNVP